jgi:HK97 gp10 family phage protein
LKLDGEKQLLKRLEGLEKKVGKKIIRKAVRAAAKPTLTAAKANARSMVGGDMGNKLAKALVLRKTKKQRRGSFSMNVRVDASKAEDLKETSAAGRVNFVPAAIEFGHGSAAAIPFMLSAAASTQGRSEQIIRDTIKNEINNMAR